MLVATGEGDGAMSGNVWVKICGVRDSATAVAAVRAGADAVGLNLVRRSPRFIPAPTARAIVERLSRVAELSVGALLRGRGEGCRRTTPERLAEEDREKRRPCVTPVLVVVNEPLEALRHLLSEIPVCCVQLHGDESVEYVAEVRALIEQLRGQPGAVIKAIRVHGPADWQVVAEFATAAGSARPDALLLDAGVPGRYGGTGKRLNWTEVAARYAAARWPPLVLAGGLRPENVAEAIRGVRPFGVDTASGVESARGEKDPELIWRFVAEARRALAAP